MTARDFFQALCVVVIWGLNLVAVKVAVTEVPAITLSFIRFALLSLILLPFVRLSWRQLKRIIPICLVMGVGHFSLFFFSLQGADAGTVAVLLQLGAPFSCLFAVIFLKDKIGPLRTGALILAFIGSACLAGDPQGGTKLAMLSIVLSAASWAWANILVKDLKDISPLAIMGWMGIFTCPVLAAMSYFWEADQLSHIVSASMVTWACLLFTVLGSSVLAYHLWYKLVGRLSVQQIAPFALLAPVISVAASVALLGEDLSLYKVLGGVMTLGGVAIIQWRSGLKRETA